MSKQILLIDDSISTLAVAKELLGAEGFEVFTASTLGEVDVLIHDKRNHLDLVLVDVQMPEMLGDELALMLRTMRRFEVPIYLLSASPEDELKRRAADVGVNGYLLKTEGMPAIVERIKAIVSDVEMRS